MDLQTNVQSTPGVLDVIAQTTTTTNECAELLLVLSDIESAKDSLRDSVGEFESSAGPLQANVTLFLEVTGVLLVVMLMGALRMQITLQRSLLT